MFRVSLTNLETSFPTFQLQSQNVRTHISQHRYTIEDLKRLRFAFHLRITQIAQEALRGYDALNDGQTKALYARRADQIASTYQNEINLIFQQINASYPHLYSGLSFDRYLYTPVDLDSRSFPGYKFMDLVDSQPPLFYYPPSTTPVRCPKFNSKSRLTADIVFVGAGPVGLWTAILTKLANRSLHIHMLEKRPKYERTQDLFIDDDVFATNLKDPDLLDVVKRLTRFGGSIPIQALEAELLGLAIKKGIVVEYSEVISSRNLGHDFPNAKHFIGSDGSRSRFREVIFENHYRFDQDLTYQVHVTYRVTGIANAVFQAGTPFKNRFDSWKAVRSMQHLLLEERITKSDPQKIRLLFEIEKTVFNAIKDAKHLTPFHLDDARIPKNLLDDLKFWFGFKVTKYNERIESDSVEITAVPLRAYASRQFTKLEDFPSSPRRTVRYSLIGDAAAGFPYRLGIGFGLKAGTKFSHALLAHSFEKFDEYVNSALKVTLEKAQTRQCWVHVAKDLIQVPPCILNTCYGQPEVRKFRDIGHLHTKTTNQHRRELVELQTTLMHNRSKSFLIGTAINILGMLKNNYAYVYYESIRTPQDYSKGTDFQSLLDKLFQKWHSILLSQGKIATGATIEHSKSLFLKRNTVDIERFNWLRIQAILEVVKGV